MAIARPFAFQDQGHIIASFRPWEQLPPCTVPPSTPVDLFVCFSQSYLEEPLLWGALAAFATDFHVKKKVPGTWQSCFHDFHAVEAGLTPEQDTYDVTQGRNGSVNWVEGPNRQFLVMAQAFQSGKWGQYETWYLMEMDSIPTKKNWMVALLQEVHNKAPFSILGSSFRGDRWDMFQTTLPATLLLHINGNAVYNVSHPLFHYFISEMSKDAQMGNFTVAFDVRTAELFMEAVLTEEEYNSYRWDSTTIGNYAATTMLHKYITTESIVHGANFFDEWQQPTALVVSDWGLTWNGGSQTALSHFLQTLQVGNHPFREIVVVRPPTVVPRPPYQLTTNGASMTVTEYSRMGSDWLDWCKAPVQSPWFMYTNVNFDFSRRIDLLQGVASQLPVATYVPQDDTYCNAECSFSVNRANQFVASAAKPARGFFLLKDTVLNTQWRNSFCASWASWNATQVKGPDVCDPLPGPTATDYMAYVNRENSLDNTYELLNAVKWGQREHGLIMQEVTHTAPSKCSFPAMAANVSACYNVPSTSPHLLPPGCAWRPGFGTAFEGSTVPVPRYSAIAQYSTCSYSDWILPIIEVSNNEGQSLTFEVSVTAPFSLPYTLVVLPANDYISIDIDSSGSLGSGTSVTGTLSLTCLFNGASITKVVPFSAYNTADLTVQLNTNKARVGDVVRLAGSGSRGSVIQLKAPPGLQLGYLFRPMSYDGWTQSGDTVAQNVLALDTQYLPAAGVALSLTVRQIATSMSGDSYARCRDFTINIVSNAPTQCSGKLTLSQTVAESGGVIQAILSPLTSNFDNSDTVQYEWRFGDQFPVNTTSIPSALLTVPFVLATSGNQVTVNAKATDSYGREQTCSTILNVTVPNLQQAAAQAGCITGTASQAVVSKCLEIAGSALSGGTNVAYAQNLLFKSLSAALEIIPSTSSQTNQILSNLVLIAQNIPLSILNDDLQWDMVALVNHLIAEAPLSDSSGGLVLEMVGPLLKNSVAQTTASNANKRQQNAENMMAAVDKMLASLACTSRDLYQMKNSFILDCIDAQWGTQTKDSTPQNYGKGVQICTIDEQVHQYLPSNVCLQVVHYTNSCNALRGKLRSTQNLTVVKIYDANTGQLANLSGLDFEVWRTSLFPVTTTAQSSRLLQGDAKFQVLAVSECIALDSNGNPTTAVFDEATGTCSSQTTGSLTANYRLISQSPSPSPSASQKQSDDGNGIALAVGLGVGIGVGVLLIVVSCGFLAYGWLYPSRYEGAMAGTFEPRGIPQFEGPRLTNTPMPYYVDSYTPEPYDFYYVAPPPTPVDYPNF